MGRTAARSALLAGVLVLLVTLAQQVRLGPTDLTVVACAGLLVAAGAAAVGFASGGTDRRTALLGAGLAAVPALLLAGYLAASDG